jgi:hypothetical protein
MSAKLKCVFSKREEAPFSIWIGDSLITSEDSINLLDLTFNSRLCLSLHIRNVIDKSNKSLNAMKIIWKYFNTTELLQLSWSNFYSITYYISEVWHINCLKQHDKKLSSTASANALILADHHKEPMISCINLHKKLIRGTPKMYCNYKLVLMLFETFSKCRPECEMTWAKF